MSVIKAKYLTLINLFGMPRAEMIFSLKYRALDTCRRSHMYEKMHPQTYAFNFSIPIHMHSGYVVKCQRDINSLKLEDGENVVENLNSLSQLSLMTNKQIVLTI